MHFNDDGDLVLDSGKRLYCNLDTVGLNASNQLVYGSDGSMQDELTKDERYDIALHMIRKWLSYAEDG
jgi:hypothetical protein